MPGPAYEPLGTRAKWVVVVLVLAVAADLVAIVSGVAEYRLLGRIDAGEFVSDADVDANDMRQAAVGIVQLVLYVVAAFLFIRWFHRAYKNLLALGAGQLRFSPGWAIGAWFVPFLNLWRPKQIANDIWRASDPRYPTGATGWWRDGDVPAVFQAWWALFLLSNWSSQVALRLSLSGEEASELQGATLTYLVSDATDLAAAILAVVVVLRTTARQDQRAWRPPAP